MGQKINPVSLRLQSTNRNFDTSWYSSYFYKQLLTKDLFLQSYLNDFLKLVKLPEGRYSIQHLQKKTQVFNFLCYSKPTREWRLRLLGLTPRNKKFKKNRYFFNKIGTSLSYLKLSNKKKRYNKSKLRGLSNSLNQLEIYKIQKKISSFQNRTLWLKLSKQGKTSSISSFLPLENQMLDEKKNLFSLLFTNPVPVSSRLPVPNRIFGTGSLLETGTDSYILLKNKMVIETKKQNTKFTNLESQLISFYNGLSWSLLNRGGSKSLDFEKESYFVWKDAWKGTCQLVKTKTETLKKKKSSFNLLSFLTKPATNSNLFFLKNLFVYKTLKSTILQDKTLQNSKYNNYLESFLFSFYRTPINLTCFKVKHDWQYASYLADEIVYFLEKRVPFRRIKTKLSRQLSKISTIRGIRITCSGRVGGKSKKAQRAKTECLKYGQTSLHVFSSPIDFSCKTAYTSFGSIGVKVWICYY